MCLGTDCKTTDYYKCKFPFIHDGQKYFTCSDASRPNIPHPHKSQWCPTDTNSVTLDFKSTGICKEQCPRREQNYIFD